MKYFNPISTVPERGLQTWLILVGLASGRQTISYRLLAKMLFRSKGDEDEVSRAGVLNRPLACIALLCEENDLPPLTCLVVNETTGKPGEGIMLAESRINKDRDIDYWREKVYAHDWFDIVPPTPDELLAALNASS